MNSMLETKRCFVRPFIELDIDDFLLYRNNLEWMKFQGFKGLSREAYREVLLQEPFIDAGAQFAIVSKWDQNLIGDVFIKKEGDTFWVGYTISPAFKRQGFAYEIILSMIRWIQQQGEFKIMAGVAAGNTASIQLLEKIGFVYRSEEDGELIYEWP